MKKYLSLLFVLMLAAILSVSVFAANTVYLSDNGDAYADGLTKETAVNDMASAIQLVSGGGTIVIVDTYTMNEPFTEPYHDGVITVTGGTFVFNHPKTSRYFLNGPTTFEKMKFTYGSANTAKTGMFVCRCNPIVFGEGLTTNKLTVVGAYQDPTSAVEKNLDTSITISSGTFTTVVGFARGSGHTVAFRGTSHITVNGGNVSAIYGGSIQGGTYSGATDIVVNGGTVGAVYTAGNDAIRRIEDSAKVTVNGGTVKDIYVNNVMGHADVYYFGGRIESMARSTSDDVVSYVTDGTANLIVRRGIIANEFSEFFDSATYEDGTKLSSAADAEVAVFNVLDKKPEKSNATMARVYVSNAGNGDGMTPETAISDMKVAFEMLDGIDGTIVLINDVPMDMESFYEPEHQNKIVITSYDGERYFDGGLYFCGAKLNRYYYSGNTVIENTEITFTSAPLFIGRWNDIVFGTGLEMVGNKIYVVGGYQFPTSETLSKNAKGSITIESGSYYCLIGYSRGVKEDENIEFAGSITMNLLGGEVNRIYGGPAQDNKGDNIVINIDGGEVTNFIQVGGDQGYCSNNATINIKNGSVKQVDMRNILDTVTVNWTGGSVESFACDNCMYNGALVEDAFAAAGEFKNTKYYLNYSGVEPTAEMLAFFDSAASGTPASSTEVKLTIGSTTAYINGEAKTLDAAPINRNNRTMLPVRFLANAFGVDNDGIKWDAATRTATLTNSEVTIVVTIDAPSMTVNGETVALDSPAIIENDRTYLPVRAIANALGVSNDNIKWDGATSTATLIK